MEYQVAGMEKRSDLKAVLLPWLVCFSSALFFFYEFIQGNMFASIADNLMRDFGIQADKMVYLSSIYYASNVMFLVVAGLVLDRFSTKKIMLIAMFLCITGTFVLAETHSFYMALFCRFLTGIGSAFCFIGPVRIASRWFPPQRMAFVTGAIVTMAMLGGMVSQYPLAHLVGEVGWREAVIRIGELGITILVAMALFVKDKPSGAKVLVSEEISILNTFKAIHLNTQILRAALYTSLMNMPFAILGSIMGPMYLVQLLGIDKETASMVNSMLFLGAIFGGPMIGGLSDKIRLRLLPMRFFLAASLLVTVGIIYLPVSVHVMTVLFFLLGFFSSAQIISYALVAESSPRAISAAAVSVVSILTQGGYIVYQNLFGSLLLRHGDAQIINGVPTYSLSDYHAAIILLPIGFCLAGLALVKLRETHCQSLKEG